MYRWVLILMGSLAYVSRSVGTPVTERFGDLVKQDPTNFYQRSRGGFVQEAFLVILPRYPLGYGMGWLGMIYAIFGNKAIRSEIWAEVMWPAWIYDGGFPLVASMSGR